MIRAVYDVEDLKESISRVGQLEPVLAYRKGDRYYVFVGLRRLFAIKGLAEEGRLDRIKAVLVDEPSREMKFEAMLEENARQSALTVYDKVHLAMLRHPALQGMERKGLITQSFINEASALRGSITGEELRRWYEIEKRLGARFIGLEHIKKLAGARREIRDYAVFVIVSFRVPAENIGDMERMLAAAGRVVDRERLKALGISVPELNVALNEPYVPPFEVQEARKAEARRGEGRPSGGEEGGEEELPVLMIYDYEVIRERDGFTILYTKEEPRVSVRRVSEGEVVEKDEKKYRVHIGA